jgi:hypothetical protein
MVLPPLVFPALSNETEFFVVNLISVELQFLFSGASVIYEKLCGSVAANQIFFYISFNSSRQHLNGRHVTQH